MHNLSLYRRVVLNVQQDFSVLAQWMLTRGMCLGLTLPCCVLKDTIAHQVGHNNAVILTHCYHIMNHIALYTLSDTQVRH